jgi:hypothetical protein
MCRDFHNPLLTALEQLCCSQFAIRRSATPRLITACSSRMAPTHSLQRTASSAAAVPTHTSKTTCPPSLVSRFLNHPLGTRIDISSLVPLPGSTALRREEAIGLARRRRRATASSLGRRKAPAAGPRCAPTAVTPTPRRSR